MIFSSFYIQLWDRPPRVHHLVQRLHLCFSSNPVLLRPCDFTSFLSTLHRIVFLSFETSCLHIMIADLFLFNIFFSDSSMMFFSVNDLFSWCFATQSTQRLSWVSATDQWVYPPPCDDMDHPFLLCDLCPFIFKPRSLNLNIFFFFSFSFFSSQSSSTSLITFQVESTTCLCTTWPCVTWRVYNALPSFLRLWLKNIMN